MRADCLVGVVVGVFEVGVLDVGVFVLPRDGDFLVGEGLDFAFALERAGDFERPLLLERDLDLREGDLDRILVSV